MIRRTIERLAAMEPEELRFRLLCEVRKLGGRVSTAVSATAWRREALASALTTDVPAAVRTALRRGDFAGAQHGLAGHFAARTSAFPLNAREAPQVASTIARACPGAASDAVRRADTLLAGRYDFLGYRALDLGASPDWHYDAVHRRRSPHAYWASVPYLEAASGDHKIIWELNRHQHWLALGRAYALSGEERFYSAFKNQLTAWLRANPPLVGTNWASMLELGFRSLSWLWSLELFAAAAAGDREPWIVDLLLGLDRQLTHIEQNLSLYFSPNTHLSGEALALYVAGASLPELRASGRRLALGRDILVKETTRQIRADGGHAELSAHYHRYSTDFYLLAARVARRAGDTAAPIFEEAAAAQARYLRTICDDSGERPQIGDDDGGQLFPICGRRADDCRDTLATAAVLLKNPALGIGAVPEETYWLCGAAAAGIAAAGDTSLWRSAALSASGYYISRTARGDHLLFDAGPHGFLNGGHAHADALSCTLTVAGRPFLVDPGTATYTMDAELRDRFRSSMMHNTVAIGDRSQSEPAGAFHWRTRTASEATVWRSGADCDYVEGTHAGYAPLRHTRAILAVHGVGWWIIDHILGPSGAVQADNYWHLHPAWTAVAESAHVCRLGAGGDVLALASTSPLTLLAPGTHPLAMCSPAYGAVEPAPTVRGRVNVEGPATVATFIPAVAEMTEQLSIDSVRLTTLPSSDWRGCAFRVRWRNGAMVVLAAIETTGLAIRDTAAPPERWGTADVQTDARLAAVIDLPAGRCEAVLVNGATVSSSPSDHLVRLARRVPLLRLAAGSVAPTMHEVGAG
jgi:hypothetical protein